MAAETATIARAVSLAEQLAEVNRELGLRRALYPGWVAAKKLKQEKADRCIAVMEAVRDTIANLMRQEQGERNAAAGA